MIWKVKELINYACTTQVYRNGEWIPARPINCGHEPWSQRLRAAWLVLTGKAEALVWPEDE